MFSLVVPVYKNEGSIPELLVEVGRLAQLLPGPLEAVFVVDGSPDRSGALLREGLAAQPFTAQLLSHSRNFGSFAAIRTGMLHARGLHVAVMAADLQEPIDFAADALKLLAAGEADIAVGQRSGRSDPLFSRLASTLFWALYRRLVLPELPEGGVDVFACTAVVRDALVRLEELNSSLVGLLFWVGYRRRLVPYVRAARRHGKSAWTFSRKVRYLLDSVYSFSDLPIRLLKWVGLAAIATAVSVATVVLVARALGLIQVPGYTPIVLTIIFFGGLNSVGLGILGEYVWRTFENTKRRPLSLVSRVELFEAEKVEARTRSG